MSPSSIVHNALAGLGLVASGKRVIVAGREYESYFVSGVEGREVVIVDDGDVNDTIDAMQQIVRDTLHQTEKIAGVLRGATRLETSRKIWEFLYRHVQYTKDNPLREQLRTPARLWKDRARGVDCDCYSIFISSVLTNLKVPHAFRIAAYDGDFQHVYVVVPKSGRDFSSYYTIDPVLDTFNAEAPYSKKKDFTNMKVTILNGPGSSFGFGECPPKNTALPPSPTSSSSPAVVENSNGQSGEVTYLEPLENLFSSVKSGFTSAFAPVDAALSHDPAVSAQASTPAPEEKKFTTTEKVVGAGIVGVGLYMLFSLFRSPGTKGIGRPAVATKAAARPGTRHRTPAPARKLAVVEM